MKPLPLAYVSDSFKTQGMCNEAVRNGLFMLKYIPDHLRTLEMSNAIMRIIPEAFHRVPDRFKTQEMCEKAVKADPLGLNVVLGHLKTSEMYNAAMREDPSSLIYVPDWFVA